jgi:murein DD-endopeptidase MepM/ murein hydrolase activator NlpD
VPRSLSLVTGLIGLAVIVLPVVGSGSTATAQPSRHASIFQVCPVDRHRHYVDDFGDARWVGGFHRHQGIDIFAPRGTRIRAPFDGRVETSFNWMGGIQLYVYGKRGFVFNGHLDRAAVKKGRVKAGDVVGYVGNSGDASGGSTHDHFEWHPRGGTAVDAFRLLNAACKGGPAIAGPPLRPSRL